MKVSITYYREDKPLIFIDVEGEVFKVEKAIITSTRYGYESIENKGDKDLVEILEAKKVVIDGKTCYIYMD